MLKRLSAVLVVLIFALSLVGCGAKSDNDTPSPSENATSSAAQSDPSSIAPSISREKAKEVAFKHAGVTADEVHDLEISPDRDFGTLHYEVEFKSGGYEYSYDIDATSGEIIKSEKEVDR